MWNSHKHEHSKDSGNIGYMRHFWTKEKGRAAYQISGVRMGGLQVGEEEGNTQGWANSC